MNIQFNPFSLEGKTILVSGASSGIGRETAIRCSKMGANVIISGRNADRLSETFNELLGDGHRYVVADLCNTSDIESLVSNCDALDGIVHSAGIGNRVPLKMVRESDISKVMDTNFKAPVLLQRALLKKKSIKKGASIVFITSRAASVPTAGNGLYSASKGALNSYAKVLGLELAPQKIRVNCIAPAMVWTELVEKDSTLTGSNYHEIEKAYPLGRYGKPADIANLCIYLLSDASEWMTGSCIDITGG